MDGTEHNEMTGPPVGGPPVGAGSMPPIGSDLQGGPPAGFGGPPMGMPQGGPPPGMGNPPDGLPDGFSFPEGGPPPGAPIGIGTFIPQDPVSGAYNMPVFIQAFKNDVLDGNLNQPALWYVDIRGFRSVNPKYGFLKGNIILRSLVDGMREVLADDIPIARLGADRFVFVTHDMDYDTAAEKYLELTKYLNDVAHENGVNTPLSLTGGIYYLRDLDYEAGDHNHAMDYASIAHRNAKRASLNTLVLFTDEDLEKDVRRITLEQSIDEALAEGQIEVWYQPQVDYLYGDVIGAEALARWNHPELGWVSPTEFIPILENCGKIHDLDLFIWEEACRNAGRWRNVSDGKPIPISVNVSRVEVYEEDLMEHFLMLQKKYDLPEGSLHLEVTESAFVEEADHLYEVIEALREHNMPVEMDDFGSGLSSLNMLKDVPVDVVKLDMGFMRSAINEDRGGVVLSSVIRMLQGLDTPIIAEGVETLEQAEMLKNMGCHLMQGFHFSLPMPVHEFESYIASNNAVDKCLGRTRGDSHLSELTSFDTASSYLFNHAVGGMLYFFLTEGSTESILVNDEFYQMCGLDREAFGNKRINPIGEIDEESRATLYRAASEAREFGAAPCRAKVRLTGRWIDCIMRYLGPSARGNIFSLNIYRWSEGDKDENILLQAAQDHMWTESILGKIIASSMVKCAVNDELTFDYTSPDIIVNSGLSIEEFMRRYHNSFAEYVSMADRADLLNAIQHSASDGKLIDRSLIVHYGYDDERTAQLYGRVETDEAGAQWLYAILLYKDSADVEGDGASLRHDHIIPFDYIFDEDKLVVHSIQPDGTETEAVVEKWTDHLDSMPHYISQTSAAKVLAAIRDLRHYPTSGFVDLKCNLHRGNDLRWYHINYSCDTDGQGNATAIHGYAHDANDQIGSAKWWRRQAEIDQLTGLLNRSAVEQEINLSMRTQGIGMMFMIDLDGFKRVNDDLGHLSGDALLRDVASTLAEHFREGDFLGRYGGDEFVAFVPAATGNPHQIAARRSAEIIEAVAAIQASDGTPAGCSIGVAISYNRESTFYDLLEVADQAMYQTKLAGKGAYTILEME